MKRLLSLILASALMLSGSAQKQMRKPLQLQKAGKIEVPRLAPFKEQAEPFQVPVNWPLGKNDPVWATLFTVIDVNGDGRSWAAMGSYIVGQYLNTSSYPDITTCDDWAVSPAVALKAGVNYTFTLDVAINAADGVKGQEYEVMLGSGNTPADLTSPVIERNWFCQQKGANFETVTATFTVPADGNYHFGLHTCSDITVHPSLGMLKCKNLTITAQKDPSQVVTPATAGIIEYALAPKGELKAHVKYTAPTLDKDGKELSIINKVTITNRWYETFDYENVEPGSTIELDVELYNGSNNNRLEGVAYLLDGAGELIAGDPVIVERFYAGLDNPLPPANVEAHTTPDGKTITLSWNPVDTIGENGGYVDLDKVTYYVFDAFGTYYDPAIATTNETSITFDKSELDGQDFFAYQVTAGMDETYYSLHNTSNITVAGKPFSMPFHESFANSFFSHVWTYDPETGQNMMVGTVSDTDLPTNADDETAEPEYLTSQDIDNGFFYVMPIEKDELWGLVSLATSIEGAQKPVLDFFYQGYGSVIDVMIGTFEKPLEVVKSIDLKQNPTPQGWTLCRTDLSDYLADGAIRFEIRVRSIHNTDDAIWSVPLDNIRIHDLRNSDLEVLYLEAPTQANAPCHATLTAKVENVGTLASDACQVALFRGDKLVDAKSLAAMEPNTVAFVTLTDSISLLDPDTIDYVAKVLFNADMLTSNNEAAASLKVSMPLFPVPTNLEVQSNGTLSWTAPDCTEVTKPVEVTDNFDGDDYVPFAIDGIGSYTMIDGDADKTYSLYDYDNPNATKPMAFEVFDASLAGFPAGYEQGMEGHSGMRYLAAPSCKGLNDNWLISPALSGEAQTITFWARSYISAWSESFKVMYSTTDNARASFKQSTSVESVPEEWTQYKVTLPAGAKHFAIVHNSNDTYALFVDDISYKAAPALPADLAVTGYNIYRNSQLAGYSDQTGYTDSVENGTYEYRVSALYNYGESRLSEPVTATIETTSIEEITLSEATSDGARYFGIDGIERPSASLTPGLYIRVTPASAAKVIIK